MGLFKEYTEQSSKKGLFAEYEDEPGVEKPPVGPQLLVTKPWLAGAMEKGEDFAYNIMRDVPGFGASFPMMGMPPPLKDVAGLIGKVTGPIKEKIEGLPFLAPLKDLEERAFGEKAVGKPLFEPEVIPQSTQEQVFNMLKPLITGGVSVPEAARGVAESTPLGVGVRTAADVGLIDKPEGEGVSWIERPGPNLMDLAILLGGGRALAKGKAKPKPTEAKVPEIAPGITEPVVPGSMPKVPEVTIEQIMGIEKAKVAPKKIVVGEGVAKTTRKLKAEGVGEGSVTGLGTEGYIQAKKNPAGHYQLFFRGTKNEIFPGEKFASVNEARQYWRAMKVKEGQPPPAPAGKPAPTGKAKPAAKPLPSSAREPWEMTEPEYAKYVLSQGKVAEGRYFKKKGVKATAAFRDNKTGRVIETGAIHDLSKVPKAVSEGGLGTGEWDIGFVEKGKFYDREAYRIHKAGQEHKGIVAKALSEGKPVPEAVLAEYPELGKKGRKVRVRRKKEAPVETKPIPKVEEGEPGIIGLSKAEQNRIRADLELDKLDPVKRKTWERTLSEAKEGKFDENALGVADEVLKTKRPITDTEHAGMVLKSAKMMDEYNARIKEVSSLIEKGDTKAAQMERTRADAIADQLDMLTEGARQGGREAGRALSIRRMMVNQETYDIAHVTQQARAAKGSKLTTAESAKLEKMTAENTTLEVALKEIEVKYEKLLADKEKVIAEGVTNREARKAKIGQRTVTAKERIVADRANIKKQLTEMGFRVNDVSGVTTEGAYLVGRLATTYIKEGVLTLKEVVQKVLVDLPQLTERDVYRSLAMKNHKAQQRARIEVNRRVARLKTQARLLVDIEKAEKGVFEPRRPKAEQLPEIKQLQRKLRELRNGAYKADIEAAKLEKALQTINELQDQLANHHRAVRNGRALDAPELAAMKEKIKKLRSQMRVGDELTRLDEQLRTGEFEVRERPVPKQLPPEIERAQIELKRKRQQIRAAIDDMAPMTARKMGVEAINTLRTMKATADMSGVLRQGLILSVRRPIKAAGAFGKSAKAFFSKHTAEQVDNAIRSADHHYIREKSGLQLVEIDTPKLTMREEMFMARVIEKVPVVGHIVKASNRHMVTYLNMMRTAAFDQFLKKYPNATHAELTAWANAVNVFSGRGNLGRASTIANELSIFVFAPRFSVSRVQTPYMFFKYIKEPRVRAEIAKDLVSTAGLGATILTLAHLSGAEVGLSPREADFGKIKIGDTRIDIWGGCQQPIRLVTRIGLAVTDRVGLTGRELSKQEKQLDPLELIGRFSAYKVAPSVTIPRELITSKTAVGEPVTPTETAARAAVPMVYESIYEAYKLEGPKRAALVGGLEFLGVSVGTYKDSESRIRRDIRRMVRAGNTEGAKNKRFEWNMENPDDKISIGWINKLLREIVKK